MLNSIILLAMTISTPQLTGDLNPLSLASETLRDAVVSGSQARDAGGTGLAPMVNGAIAARDLLGKSQFGAALDEIVTAGRWRGVIQPDSASYWLESELNALLSDLEFEPVLEAALPLGFPGLTPVREIELKQYPAYRSVTANLGGLGSGGAFWKLFAHITTNDIAMTAPVEMSYDSKSGDLREAKMAFLYGDPEVGVVGRDGLVEVEDADAGWVVSMGCRGIETQANIEQAYGDLIDWVAGQPDLEVSGEMRVMGYNSPMVTGKRRYFEVQIPVQRISTPVLDFGDKRVLASWNIVNDSVMGGRSTSQIWSTADGTGLFIGNVSLENNGGFASVRSGQVAGALEGASQVILRFRGDGRTYKLRMYTEENPGVGYQASFETIDGEWTERTFLADDFTPMWRGRVLSDLPDLSFDRVARLGVIISDGQTGAFRIELGSVEKR
ncbi:MAG: NADH dehydrogenase [ubiquinone] 1 alpha subcomplex assembly factor 1 [Bacteroidia bacterium]